MAIIKTINKKSDKIGTDFTPPRMARKKLKTTMGNSIKSSGSLNVKIPTMKKRMTSGY